MSAASLPTRNSSFRSCLPSRACDSGLVRRRRAYHLYGVVLPEFVARICSFSLTAAGYAPGALGLG